MKGKVPLVEIQVRRLPSSRMESRGFERVEYDVEAIVAQLTRCTLPLAVMEQLTQLPSTGRA